MQQGSDTFGALEVQIVVLTFQGGPLVRLYLDETGHVRFRYKDYRADRPETPQTMTLVATEFMRRFLLDVLPAGFHRIRYYGLLGNRHRTEKLARCRHPLVTNEVTYTLRSDGGAFGDHSLARLDDIDLTLGYSGSAGARGPRPVDGATTGTGDLAERARRGVEPPAG